MPDVNLQCYNRLQLKYLTEQFRSINNIPEHVEVRKIPTSFIEAYFASEYGQRQAKNLLYLIYGDVK